MTTLTLSSPGADLRRRLQPSREQLRVAAAMFRVATEDVTSVVVPVVAAGPTVGAGPAVAAGPAVVEGPAVGAGIRLEYPGGYWLADRGSRDGAYSYLTARDAAEAAAEAHLRANGRPGVPAWVSIRPDGSWSALDGA